MAMDNLLTTQHREMARFAYTRGGRYTPKVRTIQTGEYVYWKRQTLDTLNVDASPIIWQVAAMKKDGKVTLRVRDDRTVSENAKNVLLCFLPDVDGTVDHSRAAYAPERHCYVCTRIDGEDTMIRGGRWGV